MSPSLSTRWRRTPTMKAGELRPQRQRGIYDTTISRSVRAEGEFVDRGWSAVATKGEYEETSGAQEIGVGASLSVAANATCRRRGRLHSTISRRGWIEREQKGRGCVRGGQWAVQSKG